MKIEKPGFYRNESDDKIEVQFVGTHAFGLLPSGHPWLWDLDGRSTYGPPAEDLVDNWREPVSRTLNLYLVGNARGLVVLDESMTSQVPFGAMAHKRVTITEGEGMSSG